MKTKKISLIIIIAFYLGSCINRAEPEMHLIPKGYQGYVIIIFEDPNGQAEKYEDGFRVYEIPTNGILRTKFSRQNGWIANGKLKYYHTDGKNKTEIKEALTENEAREIGKVCIQNKELSVDVRYLVCSYDKRDKYFEEMHKKLDELFPPTVQ